MKVIVTGAVKGTMKDIARGITRDIMKIIISDRGTVMNSDDSKTVRGTGRKYVSTLGLLCVVVVGLLSACTQQSQLDESSPVVYINKNLGFAVKGYSYEQQGLVCDIENYLVESLVNAAAYEGIRLELVSTAQQTQSKARLLALDIDTLKSGQNKRDFVGHQAVEPELGVVAAYVDRDKGTDVLMSNHKCVAFSDQMGLDSAGSSSNCNLLRQCARRLSGDVISWLAPKLGT